MRFVVEMSGEHETLPAAEVRAVFGVESIRRDGRVAVVDADRDSPYGRLALAHHVGVHLASADSLEVLVERAADWDGIESPFAVRASVQSGGWDRQAIMDRLGDALAEDREVDLQDPASVVRVVAGERLHAHRLLASVDRAAMRARVPHERAAFKPTSLAPKLARAMVNLAEPEAGLWDPFCGTGGILLETALLGDRAVGGDVAREAVIGARRNLAEQRVSAALYQGDVRQAPVAGGVDAVATDPPYGRSTRTGGAAPDALVEALLVAAADVLGAGDRVVVGLPKRRSAVPVGEIVDVHALRVHKSLTRNITVVEM